MNAGRLNRPISIRQTVSTARSTDGEPIKSVSTVLTDIWADVRPISAREFFRADNRYADVDTLFTLRYTSVITQTMTVAYNGSEYDIKSVIDVNDRHTELQVLGKKIT